MYDARALRPQIGNAATIRCGRLVAEAVIGAVGVLTAGGSPRARLARGAAPDAADPPHDERRRHAR